MTDEPLEGEIDYDEMFESMMDCEVAMDDLVDRLADCGVLVRPDQRHVLGRWVDLVGCRVSIPMRFRLAALRGMLKGSERS